MENLFSDKKLVMKLNREVFKFCQRSIKVVFLVGMIDEKKYDIFVNFIIDIGVVEFFYKLIKQLFDFYFNSGQIFGKNRIKLVDKLLNIEID